MNQDNISIRLVLLVFGVFIMAFGVALSIHSGLGTTPFSTLPYVFNALFSKISIGVFTIILNLSFFLLHLILKKREFKPISYLQIPVALLFGFLIDVHLLILKDWEITHYLIQLAVLLFSVTMVGLGVFLQVKANIVILPIDSFVLSLSEKMKRGFSETKIIMEIALIVLAVLSFFIMGKSFFGVREGTLILALTTGLMVLLYQKYFTFIDRLLVDDNAPLENFIAEPYMTTENFVITISRQYGSGGHAVGEMIAEKLGISFYDSSLIDLTAKEGGFTSEFVKENEQKLKSKWLYRFYKQNYAFVNTAIPPKDLLFMVQTKVIRDITAKESCVIVGRCADYILKGHPNIFNVFVHASEAFRIERVINNYHIEPAEAKEVMEKTDKQRINYNKHYTGREWANLRDFDLSIETSLFGVDMTAAMIIDARRKKLYS